MDLKSIRSELRKLSEIIGTWSAPQDISAIERDLALEKLRTLYDAVYFSAAYSSEAACTSEETGMSEPIGAAVGALEPFGTDAGSAGQPLPDADAGITASSAAAAPDGDESGADAEIAASLELGLAGETADSQQPAASAVPSADCAASEVEDADAAPVIDLGEVLSLGTNDTIADSWNETAGDPSIGAASPSEAQVVPQTEAGNELPNGIESATPSDAVAESQSVSEVAENSPVRDAQVKAAGKNRAYIAPTLFGLEDEGERHRRKQRVIMSLYDTVPAATPAPSSAVASATSAATSVVTTAASSAVSSAAPASAAAPAIVSAPTSAAAVEPGLTAPAAVPSPAADVSPEPQTAASKSPEPAPAPTTEPAMLTTEPTAEPGPSEKSATEAVPALTPAGNPTPVPSPEAAPTPTAAPTPPRKPTAPQEPVPETEPTSAFARPQTREAVSAPSGAVLGEVINHNVQTLADTISPPRDMASALRRSEPVADLRRAIGINDKFLMIRDLFDGDGDAFEAAVAALNVQDSLDDCMVYIAEHYAWNPDSDGAKLLVELLERKYA